MRPALQQLQGKKGLVGAEIGVALGNNAKRMINNLHISKLYLVDPFFQYVEKGVVFKPWEKYKEVVDDLEGFSVNTQLVWLTVTSFEASHLIEDDSLDFVYIDANHEYEFVKSDIKLWWPKVKKGGTMCGHDYGHPSVPGVKKAVDEAFPRPQRLCTIAPDDWWIIK